MVLNKVESILEKPRSTAYTPQALVEISYSLLSLGFDESNFEKKMFNEYSGSRPWWLSDDLDYPTAVTRLRKLVELLRTEARL